MQTIRLSFVPLTYGKQVKTVASTCGLQRTDRVTESKCVCESATVAAVEIGYGTTDQEWRDVLCRIPACQLQRSQPQSSQLQDFV